MVKNDNADISSLMHTLVFGLRGVGAYAHHAALLGKEDDTVYNFIYEALSEVIENKPVLNEWLGPLKCGEINLKVMELLDAANTETYGHLSHGKCRSGRKKERPYSSQGTTSRTSRRSSNRPRARIFVYTHGEMLPTRLPGPEEIPAFLRPLRDRLAEPAQGICGLSRVHRHDHELYPETAGIRTGQYFHRRPRRLAGR